MIKIDIYFKDGGIQLYKDGIEYAYYPADETQLMYFVHGMAHMHACGYQIEYHANDIEQAAAHLMKHV